MEIRAIVESCSGLFIGVHGTGSILRQRYVRRKIRKENGSSSIDAITWTRYSLPVPKGWVRLKLERMPTWLKVVLAIVVAALVVWAAASVVTWRSFTATRATLVEQGAAIRSEGAAYGHGREVRECIGESLRRLQSSREFTNEVSSRLFLDGCLSTATVPPSFCESVPRQDEAAAAEWPINECRSRDAAEISRCSRVMQEVLRYCDRARSRKPSASHPNK